MIPVTVARMVVHHLTHEPLVVLIEEGGDRCVGVSVRAPQADVVSQGSHPARGDDERLTQDLVADLARVLGRRLDRAEITDLVDGRFTADLVLDDDTRLPARPSDALAIAVRDDLAILMADHVVASAGQSFAQLWGDRPPPPHEQVAQMRRFLDETTAADFEQPPPPTAPPEPPS
jgi:uncharacterized protein